MQLKSGNAAGAIVSAQTGLTLATEAKNDEYIRLNTQLLELAKKGK